MMKKLKFFALLSFALVNGACSSDSINRNGSANATESRETITVAERPAKIQELMKARGEQDLAEPKLTIVAPAAGSIVNQSVVKVRLDLTGELKGYMPHMDNETKMGNHIHVILDNQPYEAYYNLDHEFELRNVADGDHTLRVFPSRPWHESYKNAGAFQMVKFSVRNGGGDPTKPATTNGGSVIANSQSRSAATVKPEGKDMQNSMAGDVDPLKPLLTFSRPKGEYKGADANPIMLDFWLANAKLVGDGGEYRIRYSVNGANAAFLDKWEPIWLSGWTAGKNSVKVELVDRQGNLVENGGYNSTTREITVVK